MAYNGLKIKGTEGKAPEFCQYANGQCDQTPPDTIVTGTLFLFPNEPATISKPIELAIEDLRSKHGQHKWTSWKDLDIGGQIIFCEICKAIKCSDLVVADVTTLNFNLLFEIGYSIGLGVPTILIRDTSYIRDKLLFDALGILDTIGYIDFKNSSELADGIIAKLKKKPLALTPQDINKAHPVYVVKSLIDTDGSIRIISSLKKSGLIFRTFDPREDNRLSLHEAWKQVTISLGIVAHLLDNNRDGSQISNARCAFVSGLAMSIGKTVLMLYEGSSLHPIDYRDVIKSYDDITKIPKLIELFCKEVIKMLQYSSNTTIQVSKRRLGAIDLGDIAAENEIGLLQDYFIPTGPFHSAIQGHKRIVVGRKGSGKTAIFYRIRDIYEGKIPNLVIDLKPEGHQFVKLRETVLSKLSEGLQDHTMTAFWHYILLLEIAHKIVNNEHNISMRDPFKKALYDKVYSAYNGHYGSEQGDFSERLLKLVEDITKRYHHTSEVVRSNQVTALLYKDDIKQLQEALENYLALKKELWILVDNLDKGWPVKGATKEDILILRTLLFATRKMQRQFEKRKIEFKALVFIRNDIYDHLLMETPDREKDTLITLDWDDIELFKEMILTRIKISVKTADGNFEDIWRTYFTPLIYGMDSFAYMVERTLMRPRDLLKFIQYSLEIAINRNHGSVTESDIEQAEKIYSEDMLQNIIFEIKDIFPDYPNLMSEFLCCCEKLSSSELRKILSNAKISAEKMDQIIETLLWFGFLGMLDKNNYPKYAYEVKYAMFKLKIKPDSMFTIHPAFRKTLECVTKSI